jgi:hypothetical protein
MKRITRCLLVISLLAGLQSTVPFSLAADATAKPTNKVPAKAEAAAQKTKAKRDWYPFSGVVASVNKQAYTISLQKKEGERVLRFDSKSKLEIEGKPAVLADVKVGSYAHGTLHKDSAGNEVITSAKFDKEPPQKLKVEPEKAAKKAPTPKAKD